MRCCAALRSAVHSSGRQTAPLAGSCDFSFARHHCLSCNGQLCEREVEAPGESVLRCVKAVRSMTEGPCVSWDCTPIAATTNDCIPLRRKTDGAAVSSRPRIALPGGTHRQCSCHNLDHIGSPAPASGSRICEVPALASSAQIGT